MGHGTKEVDILPFSLSRAFRGRSSFTPRYTVRSQVSDRDLFQPCTWCAVTSVVHASTLTLDPHGGRRRGQQGSGQALYSPSQPDVESKFYPANPSRQTLSYPLFVTGQTPTKTLSTLYRDPDPGHAQGAPDPTPRFVQIYPSPHWPTRNRRDPYTTEDPV